MGRDDWRDSGSPAVGYIWGGTTGGILGVQLSGIYGGVGPSHLGRSGGLIKSFTQFHEDRTDIEKLITSDAQTSGGLLISISPEKTESFLQLFNEQSSIKAQKIGKITEQREKAIFVL